MTNPPKVAVIIPCFNHGEFLPEAVASVDALGRKDVEIVIVDDGSKEERTREEVEKLARSGINVIQQENRGLAAARNVGIASTTAQYIFPLDADDRMRGGGVERGIQILDSDAEVGVVYGNAQCFGTRTNYWPGGPFDRHRLLAGNFIHASALYRRVVWECNGGYDGTMPVQGYEDWDFWLGAMERGWKFEYVPLIFFDYRQHTKSMLTHAVNFEQQIKEFACRKHYALFARGFVALANEHRVLVEDSQSIKATGRTMFRLLKSRVKRKLHIREHRNGASTDANG
jgi:glycosyltransferase involved in cell wall biosynthesis